MTRLRGNAATTHNQNIIFTIHKCLLSTHANHFQWLFFNEIGILNEWMNMLSLSLSHSACVCLRAFKAAIVEQQTKIETLKLFINSSSNESNNIYWSGTQSMKMSAHSRRVFGFVSRRYPTKKITFNLKLGNHCLSTYIFSYLCMCNVYAESFYFHLWIAFQSINKSILYWVQISNCYHEHRTKS